MATLEPRRCTSLVFRHKAKSDRCGMPLLAVLHDDKLLLCPACDLPAETYGDWLAPRLIPDEIPVDGGD